MQRYGFVLVSGVLLTGSLAQAVLISDDFQSGTGAWDVANGFSRVDLGGGQYVFMDTASPDIAYSVNGTPLPAGVQIDFDFALTQIDPGAITYVFFHLANPWQNPRHQKGYQLRYTMDWGFSPGLQLWEQVAEWGPDQQIGYAEVGVDTNTHHVRIIDDGTGLIRVYWDDMTTPVIAVDDTLSYSGGSNMYVGLFQGNNDGWVDNFVVTAVPEPASLALLALGGLDLLRRRTVGTPR